MPQIAPQLTSNQTVIPQDPRLDAIERLRIQLGATTPILASTSPLERLVEPQETTRYAPPTEEQKRGVVAQFRDNLLARAANNPLQRLAAPILGPIADYLGTVPVGPNIDRNQPLFTVLQVLENIGAGAAKGAVLIPDDAAVIPTKPNAALQFTGMMLAAAGEGATADLAILKGLHITKAKALAQGKTRMAGSADAALRLFGQGADASIFRQMAGAGALGATSEIALRTAAGQPLEQIIVNAGFVGVGGAALGGAVVGVALGRRAAVSTPKALTALIDEVVLPSAKAQDQALFEAIAKAAPDESGIMKDAAYLARLDELSRATRAAKQLDEAGALGFKKPTINPASARTTDPLIESIFERASPETALQRLQRGLGKARDVFRESFVFEAKALKFPSITGIPELTLADDFRELGHVLTSRADRTALEKVKVVVGPIIKYRGQDFTSAWEMFERIVVLRDLEETVVRGLKLPMNIDGTSLLAELPALESRAPKEILLAAEHHRQLVGEWRKELIRRGKLEAGDGYEYYFPHKIIEDLAEADAYTMGLKPQDLGVYPTTAALKPRTLKETFRPYTKERKGSFRAINTDYIDVMQRAGRKFYSDNALDDFINEVGNKLGIPRAALTPEELARLDAAGAVVRNNQRYRIFEPKGPHAYRALSVSEKAWDTFEQTVNAGLPINATDLPELRSIAALGRPKRYILPEEVVERFNQFYQPDPLRDTAMGPVKLAVTWWKRNTIYWGLMRFSVFQILGDSANLFRSNLAAFLQIRNNRLDAPTLRAVNEIFKKYGTPMMSPEQLTGALSGGIAAVTADEIARTEQNSLPEKIGAFLAGSGLGYVIGTRMVAGTRRPFSAIYDEADRLAAINSGFVFSEEEVSRRALGQAASYLPQRGRSHFQRSLDTVGTILTGKVKGDPYALGRVPAEIIQTFQIERENVLRLASYMQMAEKGIPTHLAAKRARESLVDYGKFTEFENRVTRGFWLPFYAFYRHNIPNWIKAPLLRDVGGKVGIAALATAVLGLGDIGVEMWNRKFFPDIERKLEPYQKERFHIIVGNPTTGEPYRDRQGRHIVIGWEMPYEMALEFFGLARPGVLFSELFGIGGYQEDVSLVNRLGRTAKDIAAMKGIRKFTVDLLNPFVKESVQILTNYDYFWNAPLVPERYISGPGFAGYTPEAWPIIGEHVASTFFRQYREGRKLFSQATGKRFDPLTSAFGLGLPITRVNPDRELKGYLHEAMDDILRESVRADAKWSKRIDNVLYERQNFGVFESGEIEKIEEVLAGLGEEERAKAFRYYMGRASKGALRRRWESLSWVERGKLDATLPEFAKTALYWYLFSNEQNLEDHLAGEPSLPSIVGP